MRVWEKEREKNYSCDIFWTTIIQIKGEFFLFKNKQTRGFTYVEINLYGFVGYASDFNKNYNKSEALGERD